MKVYAGIDPISKAEHYLAMVTGARRGELCALRWDRLNFTTGVLEIRTSIAQKGADTWEKDTKTHQRRRIALDPQTLALLRAYRLRCDESAAALGLEPLTVAPARPDDDASPYRRIAADIRGAIACGALKPGDPVPTLKEITARYFVTEGTAHRAFALLTDAGLIRVSRTIR